MPTIQTQSRYAKQKQQERIRQNNIKWSKYYNDKIYLQERETYKMNHPLCEDCLSEGKVTPATDLHHIVEFSSGQTEAQKLALLRDSSNFICLCSHHHKMRHKESHTGMYHFKGLQC